MPNKNLPIYRVENLVKSFATKTGPVTILNQINLDIHQGEFLILFGPSGCGKSTLLHSILGLEMPNKGQVFYQGTSLYQHLSEDDRARLRKRQIGMVYQQPNWIKSLTARENVMFGLRLAGISASKARTVADQALTHVGMLDWAEYIPTEMSSGQQQKLALARALVNNPEVIIADEPTGNLDFNSGKDLMKLMKQLNQHGKTVVMVTHDLEYLRYAGRALVMFDGQIVEQVDKPIEYLKKHHAELKRGIE